MNFWSAPIQACYSKPFYAGVSRDSSKKGFLYLLYLSALVALLLGLALSITLAPSADRFAVWLEKNMPVLTLNAEGFSMSRPSPYTLNHPKLGPLVTFDVSKDDASPAQLQDVQMFVAKKNIYVREQGQIRMYALKDILDKNPRLNKESLTIDGAMVKQTYAQAKPIAVAVMLGVTWIGFFLWKCAVALFYSLFGILFNRMRSSSLTYGKVLDLTVYALTPSTVFQLLRMTVPVLSALPFLFVLDISLTLAFLYFAVKMSENEGSQPSAV